MGMISCFRKISTPELQKLLENPGNLADTLFDEDNAANEYDLDKAWHAIHYMLNSAVWEVSSNAGALIVGGTPVSEEDMGYGPARYFDEKEVKLIFDDLKNISVEKLLSKYESMLQQGEEIYPTFEDTDEDREYIKDYFEGLKRFCEKAASNNECLITYIA
jgi:hypothetical protein